MHFGLATHQVAQFTVDMGAYNFKLTLKQSEIWEGLFTLHIHEAMRTMSPHGQSSNCALRTFQCMTSQVLAEHKDLSWERSWHLFIDMENMQG